MATNTYTEEEFKKILKTLFSEKKRVKALQKQLEEKGVQTKFQAKLTDIHKLSIAEEYAALKSAYADKESECFGLKGKLEKVRPALRKLVEDLKAARAHIESIKKKEEPSQSEEFKEKLGEAVERVAALEQVKKQLEEEKALLVQEEGEAAAIRTQLLALEEELSAEKAMCKSLQEEKQTFDASLKGFEKALEEKEGELRRAQANEQKEVRRFESERSHLVERLAEGLSQVQRQTEMIKDLREENSALHSRHEGGEERLKAYENQISELKEKQRAFVELSEAHAALKQQFVRIEEEVGQERQAFSLQAQEWDLREKQLHEVTAQLEKAHAQLQESDLSVVREEYETKLLDHEKRAQHALDEMAAAHDAALQHHGKDAEALIAHLNNHIAEARVERDQAKSDYVALTEQFHQTLDEKEKILEKSYGKMRELSSRHGEMVEEMEKISQKLEEKQQQFNHLEKRLSSTHNSMQNAKLQCEERDGEIRKAQQHLAKKVKETTILRDLTERQKGQISELQAAFGKQKNELERMQNNLNLQQMHEEKLQLMAKERTQATEILAKEWQEKYLALQQDWQEKKAQLQELQKIREDYDHMASTVSRLKNILGKGEES